MKYIVIGFLLMCVMQCDAMSTLIELRKQRKQKEQAQHQQVADDKGEEQGQKKRKTIDECIRLLRAEFDEKSSREN